MRLMFILILAGLLAGNAFGQAPTIDSTNRPVAVNKTAARYESANTNPEQLYNGIEYVGYDRRLTGHPFFPSDSLQIGAIRTEGQDFSMPLLFDIVREVLVLNHPAGYRMALHSDNIQSFSVGGHTFIRMADSTRLGLPTGFYDLLYNGPTQLLAKRTKSIQINPSASIAFNYGVFNSKTIYFIKKGSHYFSVKNKRTILDVLEDHKKQLVSFIRKEKIKFKPDVDAALSRLAKQYDALTQTL
jgi:hypothetical protein